MSSRDGRQDRGIALVTGAGSGIGRALAIRLAVRVTEILPGVVIAPMTILPTSDW